jgi:hypothetical protein
MYSTRQRGYDNFVDKQQMYYNMTISDVHGLASGQKPSQARGVQAKPSQAKCHGLELALAWLQIPEAKAKPASHGFEQGI